MIKYNKFKIVNHNSGKFLYIPKSNKILKINSLVADVLNMEGKMTEQAESELKNELGAYKLRDIMWQLNELGLVKNGNRESSGIIPFSKDPQISSLTLLVTQQCNLRCKYCYGGNGEYNDKGIMSFEVAKQSVDFLFEKSGEYDKLFVIFFGGEPLLNFQVIHKVVEYVKEKKRETGKVCGFSITTNAILLTPKIKQYFMENHIYTQVSIDGDEEVTNTNRYNALGEGSYHKIIERSKMMMKNSYPLLARGTVTDVSFDITNSFLHLYQIGFKTVMLAPAYNMITKSNYSKVLDGYNIYFDVFEDSLINKDYEKCYAMKNAYSLLSCLHKGEVKSVTCSAGQRSCAIDIHGNVFPCHRFVGNSRFNLGNVIDKTLKLDSYIEEMQVRDDKCNDCICYSVCGGGCMHDNFLTHGNIRTPYEFACTIMRNNFQKALEIYVGMTKEDKMNLFGEEVL